MTISIDNLPNEIQEKIKRFTDINNEHSEFEDDIITLSQKIYFINSELERSKLLRIYFHDNFKQIYDAEILFYKILLDILQSSTSEKDSVFTQTDIYNKFKETHEILSKGLSYVRNLYGQKSTGPTIGGGRY